MGKDHRGQPSGTNRDEKAIATGKPMKMAPEDMPRNEEMTEKYTQDDSDIANNVRTTNPNRNTDKGDATNIGGYRE
jgi:hypothetical protein